MVDKVDRPDAPAPWQIKETVATKDRGQREQPQQQPFDQPDEFSSPGSVAEWHKIHREAETRRVMKIERSQVRHLWFRRATMKRQLAVLEMDLELTGGKLYRGAQAILPRFDDYFRIKGYTPGQEVAVVELFHEPIIAVSIAVGPPRKERTAPPEAIAPTRKLAWWQLWDPETYIVNGKALLCYSALIVGIITMLVILI